MRARVCTRAVRCLYGSGFPGVGAVPRSGGRSGDGSCHQDSIKLNVQVNPVLRRELAPESRLSFSARSYRSDGGTIPSIMPGGLVLVVVLVVLWSGAEGQSHGTA
jgi:hypothetical protein